MGPASSLHPHSSFPGRGPYHLSPPLRHQTSPCFFVWVSQKVEPETRPWVHTIYLESDPRTKSGREEKRGEKTNKLRCLWGRAGPCRSPSLLGQRIGRQVLGVGSSQHVWELFPVVAFGLRGGPRRSGGGGDIIVSVTLVLPQFLLLLPVCTL